MVGISIITSQPTLILLKDMGFTSDGQTLKILKEPEHKHKGTGDVLIIFEHIQVSIVEDDAGYRRCQVAFDITQPNSPKIEFATSIRHRFFDKDRNVLDDVNYRGRINKKGKTVLTSGVLRANPAKYAREIHHTSHCFT